METNKVIPSRTELFKMPLEKLRSLILDLEKDKYKNGKAIRIVRRIIHKKQVPSCQLAMFYVKH